MNLADTKCKIIKEKVLWNAQGKVEEKIIAIEAAFEKLKKWKPIIQVKKNEKKKDVKKFKG